MNRTKQITKDVYLIICADIHLREDVPVCRTDDFIEAQWRKLDFISNLQKKYMCPVVHSGDLFHHWKPSPWLLSKTIEHLPDQFYTLYGNHDLPQHNMALADKSGICTLEKAGKVRLDFPFQACHWGQEPNVENIPAYCNKKILIWHVFNYQGKEPWPGCEDPTAQKLLKQYPEFDLIITGDNHKTFTAEYEGRILINPGSMTRQTADQIEHVPCVFLWHSDNTFTKVELPFEDDVITREHLDKNTERDIRLDAFISELDTDWQAEMSFEQNLEIFKQKNNIRTSVMDIIYKSLE